MAAEAQARRIVVALDDSVHSRAALDAAAELAAQTGAELVGVYVEDVDLLRIAEMPFAAELSRIGGAPRAMSAAGMQRALKLQAERLRRLVAQSAGRHGVPWQFRAVRGRVADALLAAAEDADMIVLGKASTTSVRHVRVGRTARTVVTRATRTVVVLQHGAKIGRPVLVCHDGTPGGDRALDAAAQWARQEGDGLVVLVAAGEGGKDARARAAERLARLGERGPSHARFASPPCPGIEGLLRAVRAEGCRTLVLNADSRLLDGADLSELAAGVDCPLGVVR